MSECIHDWKLIEKACRGVFNRVAYATYVACYCGEQFPTEEEWLQHCALNDEQGITGYSGYHHGYCSYNVYDIEPATYQCSICGATKSEVPEILDGQKYEKISYYKCICGGISYLTYELLQRHKSNSGWCGTYSKYTIRSGYKIVYE